ncbi:helix-turn-helix domain-containing protein [Shewanella sp. SM32]|uniref:helix-turn-helix domain-containing protein n=1 Tax=Shewanella sp. SM32 TaxID=2912796 RepID=UPI0021DB4674|nr:helix-turn-helix transcriptional regulator [Shewanella sp. SM32]MCU8068176.1 helix-turn-helix domain-containing protein [Shewanella sp. SM32]
MEMTDKALNRYTQKMTKLMTNEQVVKCTTDQIVGFKLRLIARSFGLKDKQFAAALGVVTTTFSGYVNGHRSLPIDVAIKLNRDFGIDLNWLFVAEEGEVNRLHLPSSALLISSTLSGQTVYDPISKCDRYYPRCDTSATADAIPPSDGQCGPEYGHHAPALQDQ